MSRQIEDGYFEITCVHRADIQAVLKLSDEQTSKISDDVMEEIADKMAEDYCTQLFSESLRIIAGEVLERNGIKQG